MKLYHFGRAPNARRARVFSAEKGIDLELIEVDLGSRAQLNPDYAHKNAMAEVPALELDDGTLVTESNAICRYLEGIQPEPALFGTTALEQAQITMWDRRVELHGFLAVTEGFRNGNAFFKDRALTGPIDYPQIPQLAERGRKRFAAFLDLLETRLGESDYLAGPTFSIADITAAITCDFARVIKMGPPFEGHPKLQAWLERIMSRPSMSA
ncbi:MAG: glutathione S-transferase [Rhodospirillales bacterium]|nr:glutathione S-transferase [Rhodospirillales bacterium]